MPRFTKITFAVIILLALLGDLIATGLPLWCKIDGQSYWPAFTNMYQPGHIDRTKPALLPYYQDQNWESLPENQRFMAPVPFSPWEKSIEQKRPPFSRSKSGKMHWLGTDTYGRDVLSALITGTRTAVITGLLAMVVAMLTGGLLGAIAGYFGDTGFRIYRIDWLLIPAVFCAFLFFFFVSRNAAIHPWGVQWYWAMGYTALAAAMAWLIHKLSVFVPALSKRTTLPLDLIIMRIDEHFSAIPSLLLLLVIGATMQERTLTKMVLLIGLISWAGAARFVRSEMLKVRQMNYIESAKALGFSDIRILLRHALPNALRPVMVTFALGASGAVLLEATLSFLSLGTSNIYQVTWGSMLFNARSDFGLWWVWVFPGAMIIWIAAAAFRWAEGRS